MTGRSRLILAVIIVAVSAGAGIGAPVDLSPTEDAALRQLFSDTGGAAAAKGGKASGNPFLVKPRAQASCADAGAAAKPSRPDPGAPIDLLARPSAAPAAKVGGKPGASGRQNDAGQEGGAESVSDGNQDRKGRGDAAAPHSAGRRRGGRDPRPRAAQAAG